MTPEVAGNMTPHALHRSPPSRLLRRRRKPFMDPFPEDEDWMAALQPENAAGDGGGGAPAGGGQVALEELLDAQREALDALLARVERLEAVVLSPEQPPSRQCARGMRVRALPAMVLMRELVDRGLRRGMEVVGRPGRRRAVAPATEARSEPRDQRAAGRYSPVEPL